MMKYLGALPLIVALVCCIQIADAQPIDEEVIKVVDPDLSFGLTESKMKELRDAGLKEEFDNEVDTDDAGNEKIRNSVRYSRTFECDKEKEILQKLEGILPKEVVKSGMVKHLEKDEQSVEQTATGLPVSKACHINLNLEFDLGPCKEGERCSKRGLFHWVVGCVVFAVHALVHHFWGK